MHTQCSLLFLIFFIYGFLFPDPSPPICLTLFKPFSFPKPSSNLAQFSFKRKFFLAGIVGMASEEVQSDDYIQNQAEPPAPAVAGTMPPYPEMILAAIEALGEPNGSNKSSISKQIEATYGSLPPAHSTLLTHHLNRMKSSGHLVFAKNNYLKPNANAPPRRGRGRPPKPKAPLPQGYHPAPSRPRGRPPKSRNLDQDAPPPPPKPTSSVSGKKRGRPPKATTAAAAAAAAPPPPTVTGAPRGRGRPPKVKPAVTAPVGA